MRKSKFLSTGQKGWRGQGDVRIFVFMFSNRDQDNYVFTKVSWQTLPIFQRCCGLCSRRRCHRRQSWPVLWTLQVEQRYVDDRIYWIYLNCMWKYIFQLSSHMAEACGVIFFNVDYRLAPEAKCPENVKDFYSALKYVVRRVLNTSNTQMISWNVHKSRSQSCFSLLRWTMLLVLASILQRQVFIKFMCQLCKDDQHVIISMVNISQSSN